MSKLKKPRLGRGLSSLLSVGVEERPSEAISDVPASGGPEKPAAAPDGDGTAVLLVPVEQISPNPYQPRHHFDEAALDQLAASIQSDGVMQPIVLRRDSQNGGGYQIVAGERRWRAAQRAGLAAVPAIVRQLGDRQLAEWALIENLQREDLDPIERARAFARLVEQFGLTHEQVAQRVGIDRSTVSNSLRLLNLQEDVQEFVRRGQLSAGHVRALLGVDDLAAQLECAQQAIKAGWSVRRLEEVVRDLAGHSPAPTRAVKPSRSAHLADVARQIGEQLQTRVELKPGREKNSGRLVIDYFGLDQFDSLMRRLGVTVE